MTSATPRRTWADELLPLGILLGALWGISFSRLKKSISYANTLSGAVPRRGEPGAGSYAWERAPPPIDEHSDASTLG